VACVLHARHRVIFADRIRSVGKQARDESGKHPVNENDEETFAHVGAKLAYIALRVPIHSVVLRSVIASEAKQSIAPRNRWMDCFVAEFIIGPAGGRTRWLPCAGASRLSQAMTAFTCAQKRKCPGTGPGHHVMLSGCYRGRLTPGLQPSCRARPARRRGGRSARGRASTTRSRARSRGRTPPRQDRRHARRKCRP
jgi:hypothetical protein